MNGAGGSFGAPLAASIGRGIAVGSLLTSALIAPAGAARQDEVVIAGGPACADCRIEADEVTLVESASDVGLTPLDKLALADDGTVWVVPFPLRHAVFRYLPEGTQDLRIDEQGQGPREFTRIERIETGPDHNLYAFGNRKFNRYSASGQYIDTHAFPPQILEFEFFPDGSMIANLTLYRADAMGHVFHSFDPDGNATGSFGPQSDGYEIDPVGTRRKLAVAGPRSFWAAPINRYEVELWDVSGARERRIIRQARWFEPWEGRFQTPHDQPPLPRLWDMQSDQDGRLWVLFLLPAQQFAPLPRPTDETAAILEPLASFNPAFDVFIEVLDPESNQVVVQRRFPNTMVRGGFLPNLHVVFTAVDEEKEDQIFRITRLSLTR